MEQAGNGIGLSHAKEELKQMVDNCKPADPWTHRNIGMRCSSCMWYAPKQPRNDFGRCRRHAPTMNGYPAVFANDWCGDHKLDETKI